MAALMKSTNASTKASGNDTNTTSGNAHVSASAPPSVTATPTAPALNASPPAGPRDIRKLSETARAALFTGPTVAVHVGPQVVRGIPKKIFMFVSPEAEAYFKEHPGRDALYMGPNELAIPALRYIVNWMIDMGKTKRTFSIRSMNDFLKNMAVRRTAILMGMSQYVAHFTKVLCDAVREGLSKEQMGLVERLSLPHDAVFDCLANWLAMKREWGVAGEEDEMEKWLVRHAKLAAGVARAREKLKKR